MTARVSFAFVLVLLLIETGRGDEWQPAKSVDGRFQALMPGRARYQKQNVQTGIGKITLHRFAAYAGNGQFLYTILYNDYPAEYVKKTGAKEILLDTQKRSHGPLGDARISNDKEIKLGDHPGRQFDVTGTQDGVAVHCTWRHVLVGQRLYQLGVLGTQNQDSADNLKKFFDSFKLLEKDE